MNNKRIRVLRGVIAVIGALSLVGALAAPSSAYLRPGLTERVSVSSAGQQASGHCGNPQAGPASSNSATNGDGRYVAFDSCANNLIEGDDNNARDVFIHDRATGRTEAVSIASVGMLAISDPLTCQPDVQSRSPSVSHSGRFVAFESCARNLVTPDTNAFADIFVRDRKLGVTELISISSDGIQGVGDAYLPQISSNGRFVTFTSNAVGLVPDAVGQHVYLYDRHTDEMELIDVPISGSSNSPESTSVIGASGCSSVSADGRYVSFYSASEALIEDDDNSHADVFVRDRELDTTEHISVASDGSQGTNLATLPGTLYGCTEFRGNKMISDDGRVVVFESDLSNLVPSDTNDNFDIFIHDRRTARTERVSVTSVGDEHPWGRFPGISADGRWVTLSAGIFGCNYIPLVTGCHEDVYLYDTETGAQELISLSADGRAIESGTSLSLSAVSGDGRVVAFSGAHSEVIKNDTNQASDVFARDRGFDLGAGDVKIAGSPRFASAGVVAQADSLTDVNDAAEDLGANLYGASLAYRALNRDLFVAIELEDMPSLNIGAAGVGSAPGSPAMLYGLRFDVGAKNYEVRATSLLGGTFGLFDCTASRSACTKVADLMGGFGTTGERVVVSLPLADIGLENGGELRSVEAFSALGTYLTGATRVLDTVSVR